MVTKILGRNRQDKAIVRHRNIHIQDHERIEEKRLSECNFNQFALFKVCLFLLGRIAGSIVDKHIAEPLDVIRRAVKSVA